MFRQLTKSHTELRRNPYELAEAQALLNLLDRYGWGWDLELVQRMGDAHWEVVTNLGRISTGESLSLPSERMRQVVIDRVRTRIERVLSAA